MATQTTGDCITLQTDECIIPDYSSYESHNDVHLYGWSIENCLAKFAYSTYLIKFFKMLELGICSLIASRTVFTLDNYPKFIRLAISLWNRSSWAARNLE